MIEPLAVSHNRHCDHAEQKNRKCPHSNLLRQYRRDAAQKTNKGEGANAGYALAGFLFARSPASIYTYDGAQKKGYGKIKCGLVRDKNLGCNIVHERM